MNEQTRNLEPWQWPEEHWRKIVDHVRAGKPYRPKTWRDGGRCAAILEERERLPNAYRRTLGFPPEAKRYRQPPTWRVDEARNGSGVTGPGRFQVCL